MTSEEYEVRHFGFSSQQISLERQYVIKSVMGDLLVPMLEKLTMNENTAVLLAHRKSEVLEEMLQEFKEKLDEIEQFDVKNFCIPECVLLTKEGLRVKCEMLDERHLDEDISNLRQLFLVNSIMIAALDMESSQYSTIDTVMQEELSMSTQILKSFNAVDSEKSLKIAALTHKITDEI